MNAKITILRTACILYFSAILSACTVMPSNDLNFTPDRSYQYKNEQSLNYREIGEGHETLILLHGFGASNKTWDDVLPYLKQPGLRLILVDLIGFGFSPIPKDSDYSIEANSNAIINFIKSNDIKNYVLVGHSLGGGVALNIAHELNKPDSSVPKPNALILIDSAAYDKEIPFFIKFLQTPLLGRFLLTAIPPRLISRYLLERIYFDRSKVTDEKVDRYAFFLSRHDNIVALLESARQVIPKNFADPTSKYNALHLPTLILWGVQDTILSIEGGKRLASEIPNARFVAIEECGHNPQEEQPAEVAREIEDFLKMMRE